MTQYIDKSALVAEIDALQDATMENGHFLSSYHEGIFDGLSKVENFLDTLETKEINLEKEVEDWVKTGPHTSYPWCTIPDAIRITAEHFFELGLNARKD